ncbi:Rne/Rng family ribonuclease [Timonella sp. A28]|uniref:Rne/Rng family ribonuclease n=1 Tax=Timonella sp. A28 TaxID=3442640 RepID=UPI003EBC0309
MTLNDESRNSETSETTDKQESRKPVRRRVTRATSAPTVAPVAFLTAASTPPAQPKTTAGNATVVTAQSGTDNTESAPARRSRRVTSSGKASTASVTVSGTATEIAQQTTQHTERAAETTATPVEAPAPVREDNTREEKKSAPKKNTRKPKNAKKTRAADAEVETGAEKSEASETSSDRASDKPARNTEPTERRVRTRTRTHGVFSAPKDNAETPQDNAPAASSRPRLATTALLFQAPDLSVVPERAETTSAENETAETEKQETAQTQERPRTNKRDNAKQRPAKKAEDTEEEPAAEQEQQEAPQDTEDDSESPRRRRRRGGRGRRNRTTAENTDAEADAESEPAQENPAPAPEETSGADSDDDATDADGNEEYSSSRRRRRRRRSGRTGDDSARSSHDEVTALKGSTRLEAKRQRRREGRDAGRRRTIITEAEFLARRESVDRSMVVRERDGRTQIAVLEDGVLVEHYVSQQQQASMAGNVYLGRVQNVLPSMEAAFVDIGKGRNAVLYAGEVNWDAHGIDGQPRRIEEALKSGDSVLVQVTKDPIGHKGARLTSQITLAGRYLVYVPGGGMTGISRKLPDTERARLKRILREVVPDSAGVIVRTAAEGASEEELKSDIARLQTQWEAIEKKSKTANAPALLQGEPDLAIRVVRDIFNDDFKSLKVQGANAWNEISEYVRELAPDLTDRVSRWTSEKDIFSSARIDEQLAKGMDRKVWLPSGGSLVIDRTEAMTVIDVNTGKFTGQGGTLEETVTRNNLESAEEIVRQLRLRDIGGIIVIDFIDMVLESNRDLVLRRLVECLGRDRTKHQVAEVTSLGLVQMTRKRVGQGLVEAFSTTCDHCNGRGFIVHDEPNEKGGSHGTTHTHAAPVEAETKKSRRKKAKESQENAATHEVVAKIEGDQEARDAVKVTLATIAAAAAHAHEEDAQPSTSDASHDSSEEGTVSEES